IIVVRLDDAPSTDRDFVRRLMQRALTAEIAVPTRFVEQARRLTWRDLSSWSAAGFRIVAHSRSHSSATRGAGQFLDEVVGALDDLAARGLTTSVFVQPGSWRDSLDFDSPDKLHSWRGALVRSITSVFEDYVYRGSLVLADSIRWSIGWNTISDGTPDSVILKSWQAA